MSSDDLKSRIEALNKQALKNVPETSPELGGLRRKLRKRAEGKTRQAGVSGVSGFPLCSNPETPAARQPVSAAPRIAPEPVIYSRNAPRSVTLTHAAPDDDPVALEDAVVGTALAAPVGPDYYHIELAAVDLDACARELHAGFLPLIGHPEGAAAERIAAVCRAQRLAPAEALFLDIETTGLGNTPLFLIGTMECGPEGFVFRQYFARDYSEEMSILSAFSERLSSARMIVTFNGKSFDVPYIENRAVATGVRFARPRSHLDLLHEARRVFGRSLPNHKLQTLEQMVCGRLREDDIPSDQIPAAYHEFVRTGSARKIGLILQHNLYDLLTMADLMGRMWGRQPSGL